MTFTTSSDISKLTLKCLLLFVTLFASQLTNAQNTASNCCTEAELAEKNNDYEQAVNAYTRCLDNQPNNPKCWLGRGWCLIEIGDAKKAITDFQKALELNNQDPEIFYALGAAYKSTEDFATAESYAQQAIQLNYNESKYIIELARLQVAQGNYDASMNTIENTIKRFPENNEAKIAKGWILFYSGQYELADQYITDLYRGKSMDGEASILCAIANQAMGEFAKAIPFYSTAISANPEDDDLLYARADCYMQNAQYRESLKDFNLLLTKKPRNTEFLLGRAICKKNMDDAQGAMTDFNKVLELDSKHANAYLERGRLKFTLGDERGAISDYDHCIAIESGNALAYCMRAISKARLSDFNASMNDFNKSISLNPNNPTAYYFRGFLKIEMKNKKGACEDFSKAGELGHMEAYEAIKENCP